MNKISEHVLFFVFSHPHIVDRRISHQRLRLLGLECTDHSRCGHTEGSDDRERQTQSSTVTGVDPTATQ